APSSGAGGTSTGYTSTMANEAAAVSPYAGINGPASCAGQGSGSVCNPNATSVISNCILSQTSAAGHCATWCYDGPLGGHVFVNTTKTCFCPCITDPTWN